MAISEGRQRGRKGAAERVARLRQQRAEVVHQREGLSAEVMTDVAERDTLVAAADRRAGTAMHALVASGLTLAEAALGRRSCISATREPRVRSAPDLACQSRHLWWTSVDTSPSLSGRCSGTCFARLGLLTGGCPMRSRGIGLEVCLWCWWPAHSSWEPLLGLGRRSFSRRNDAGRALAAYEWQNDHMIVRVVMCGSMWRSVG